MVLFFPTWPATSPDAPDAPASLAKDLAVLISGTGSRGPTATPKQQDQALKRLAAAASASAATVAQDPTTHSWAATHLVPWLTAALVDPRNTASPAARPALLHALHVLSAAVHAAVHDHLASRLLPWLPTLDLADQYAVVQALFRYPVTTLAAGPALPQLLLGAHTAILASDPRALDRVLALKLAVLLVPKLASPADLPLALVSHCASLLTAAADPDVQRLAAVVVVQSLLTHPATAHSAVSLPPDAVAHDLALSWTLSLPLGLPRSLALRALLASLRPIPASLVTRATLALLDHLTHAGTALGTPSTLAVLEALGLVAPYLAHQSAVGVLDALWTYLDDPLDAVQSRARAVVQPLLALVDEPPAALVARVCAATLPASKVRYVVLASLVPVVGPVATWDACCGDAAGMQAVVASVGRHGMAGRVAEYVGAVVVAMKREQLALEERSAWIQSVTRFAVSGLTADNDLVRKHFVSHLLKPLLANVPDLYTALTTAVDRVHGDWLAARVAVERVARTLDLAAGGTDAPPPLGAATHPQAALRLDALGLLADVRRPTAPLARGDLAWLQRFLTLNVDSTDPEFRDNLLARMAKVLDRFRHSAYALGRAAKPRGPPTQDNLTAQALLDAYAQWLAWIQGWLTAHLARPACPYPVAITCLGLVGALVAALGIDQVPMPHGFHQDHCAVPTFPLAVQVDDARMCSALVRMVGGAAYEDVQRLAHALAAQCRLPQSMLNEVVRAARRLVASPRGCEAHAGALLWDLAMRCGRRHGVGVDGTKVQSEQVDVVFVDTLVAMVQHEADHAQVNLLSSAQSSPLPGTLLALQVMLSHVCRPEQWIERLARVCKQATGAVLDVLTDDAPEGNLPEHLRDDAAADGVGENDNDDDVEATTSTSQLLLSYSWRVVKHACDLMGAVMERVDAKAHASLLTDLGSHFISLMLTIRHRGAFCAVQPNLVRVTDTLAKSVGSHALDTWMASALTAVAQSDYSVTRRSGGLPYVILALVSSPRARYLLPTAMTTLFDLAHAPAPSVKVNAMNTLRRLLDDRQLARDTPAWVEPALLVALAHLHHADWAVRNGALMLHASLLTRVFGSRASAGQGDRTRGLTAREFFARYPKLHAALRQHLQAALDAPEGPVVAGAKAFPLLVVLARLAPSPTTTSASSSESALLASFDVLVRQCLASPVWKVREVAAEALVALAEREALVGRVVDTVGQLVVAERMGQNKVHGSVLYVRSLVSAAIAVVGQEAIGDSLAKNAVMQLVDHVRQSCASPYVQALAIQVATMVVGQDLARDAALWYRQGISAGYGSELVKSRLAEAMLLGSDTTVLETLLIQEQDPLIHSLVLETLADPAALGRLLPFSPQVTSWLLTANAPRVGLRTKILVDAGHNLPTAHLLQLVSDPTAVALNLRVPLIHALATAALGDATVAATYLDVLAQWALPEAPQFVRQGCADSLDAGLAHVRASAGLAALARLVWVVTSLLVQDDDEDIRDEATSALGRVLADADQQDGVHSTAMLPRAMHWLVAQAKRDPTVHQVLEPLWRATLHKYLVPALMGGPEKEVTLFDKEDPNLFKDYLREAIAVASVMKQIGAEVECFRYLVATLEDMDPAWFDRPDVSTSLTVLLFLFGEDVKLASLSLSMDQVMAIAQQFTLGDSS